MKSKLLQATLLMLLAMILITGCKKEETIKKNSFIYNQKESIIGTVFGESFDSETENVFVNYVYFFEKKISVQFENGYPIGMLGKGDVLILSFYTNKRNEVPTGEYTLGTTSGLIEPFTFDYDWSVLLVGYSNGAGHADDEMLFSSGKVKVTKIGDEYEFTINLETRSHSNVKGYYKGKAAMYTVYPGKKNVSIYNQFPIPN